MTSAPGQTGAAVTPRWANTLLKIQKFVKCVNMATVILTRVGPSGPNKEYLYNLTMAMKELVPHVTDTHLEELDKKVRELEASGTP